MFKDTQEIHLRAGMAEHPVPQVIGKQALVDILDLSEVAWTCWGCFYTQQWARAIWSEWRLTIIAATVRIALVDILDLFEVNIPAGCLLYTSPSPRD